ncbi:MAG: hypothetical protein D6705_12555 [Deltaproteobacteria bacterium]|nr:MAG: hypothetical protein D6705_12555 [Deltaproteobacteria bacterium]
MKVHYIEFVSPDVDMQCRVLAGALGLTFGAPVADLGNARIASADDGTLVGVRAPLAEHEAPIVRTYFAVDDIESAIAKAQRAGATIAYGPTRQGETGTWAIVLAGEVQVGLWQP